MPSKFGLDGIGLRCNLEAKSKYFYFGTEIQDSCHEIFVQKYELQISLVIPTKFGLAGIGLRGHLILVQKSKMAASIFLFKKYELQT